MLDWRSAGLERLMLAGLVILGACGGNVGDGSGGPDGGEAGSNSATLSADSGDGGSQESDEGFYLGGPRDDVERFFGLYGERGQRQFFVTEAKRPEYAERSPEIPPGYLAIDAMWGDVAPMHMKSLSESTFEQVDRSDFAPDQPNVAEFEFGADGKAVALTFTKGSFSQYGRRERVGDLPEKFR